MAAKRQASPLEAAIAKKKSDLGFDLRYCPATWISTEDPSSDTLTKNSKGKEKRTGKVKPNKEKLPKPSKEKHDGDMAEIVASLRTLESLYGSLDKKVVAIHSNLDGKLEKLAGEQSNRFERIESLLQEHEGGINFCREKLSTHNERLDNAEMRDREQDIGINTCREKIHSQEGRLERLETEYREKIAELNDYISRLNMRIKDMEVKNAANNWSTDKDNYDQTLQEIIRKLEYQNSRLDKHDRKFMDVYVDLKDKYLSIGGIPENRNENVLELVLNEFNDMLRVALPDPEPITRADVDMVYRSGKFARNFFPRQITVILVRKGLKQFLISTKRGLGWDMNNKVTYSDEMDSEVRNLRESLKAIASRAENGDYTVKMASNRIYINGVAYGYDDLDIVPVELRRGIPQMKRINDGIAFRGRECFLSNFYPCNIVIDNETYSSVEQYYQHTKCASCNDYDRARKILKTDDPLQAKIYGDNCEEKKEWIENKVFTMFKGMFYKFSQNEFLVNKLLSTDNLKLYEATTDMLYGAGIGLNSKRWEMGNWEGKNVAGKLLCKVRGILKNKLAEGLTLNKLVFKYSLPSLRDDEFSRHRDLFLGHCHPEFRGPQDIAEGYNISKEYGGVSIMSVGEESTQATCLEKEKKDLTEDLNDIGNKDDTDSSLYTLCVRRKSHSLENKVGSVHQRNNPTRKPDSLTRRERVFMKKPEEISQEDILDNRRGFERSYGLAGHVKTSTPTVRDSTGKGIGKAQQFLLDYLGLDINSEFVQHGLRQKQKQKRPDTPMPGVEIGQLDS